MLQNQVRAEPSEARHRVFLFQLLSVMGQWDRALTQLNVAGEMDAGNLGMVQVYREALATEALRAEIFSGNRAPLIFGDPERWIALLLEALKLSAAGKHQESEALRDEALDAAPATSGRLNGREFEWISDADSRIGPMLEAIFNGRYFWVPFDRIAEIRIDEPEDLRDLVWLPAQLQWMNGGEAVALIPVRYPGSESSSNPKIQLGRLTEWDQPAENFFTGLGQRMVITDQDEFSLLEIRNVTMKPTLEVRDIDVTQASGDESQSDG